jgi:hypothetical protein
MRMLGEMAVDMPQVRSFTEFARVGLGNWAGFSVGWLYWFFWVVVVPVEAIAGAAIIEKWIAMPTWEIGVVLMARDDRREHALRPRLRRVRVLVLLDQGDGDRRRSSSWRPRMPSASSRRAGRASRTWSRTAVLRRTAGSPHSPR